MKNLSLILIAYLAFIATIRGDAEEKEEESFKPKYPEKLLDTKTFKKFIKLVELHNLNVSVVASKTDQYKDGNIQDLIALSMTFPPNDVALKASTLSKDDAVEFMKIATTEKLTACGSKFSYGSEPKHVTNNPSGEVVSYAMRTLTTIEHKGNVGFHFKDTENFVAHETLMVPGADGHKDVTKIFYGSLNVDVVKSAKMDEKELEIVKKSLMDSLFMYDTEIVARAFVTMMDKALPGFDWQVVDNINMNSYLDAEKYAYLSTVDGNYTLFSHT